MQIVADTHTHTLACGHAFSTITENAAQAQRLGLDYLFLCEHSKAMPGSIPDVFFESTLSSMPDSLFGVYLIRGIEANVMGPDGQLDVGQALLTKLEWVIASMHPLCLEPMEKAECTSAWLAITSNPHVDVLGHCGDPRYPFDHEAVIRACAQSDTIVEINNHSFEGRPGSFENCRDIALLCKRYDVPVVVSSDAHFWTLVGQFDLALNMLDEIGFPEELVLNADRMRMADVLHRKCGRRFAFDNR